MASFLTIRGYVFDTQALKDAYLAVPPATRPSVSGYDEAVLEALLRYFADWGPARNESLRASPERSLDSLGGDEKRDLYNVFTNRLAKKLEEQYRRDIDQAKFEGFLHRLADQPLPEPIGTFFLRWLWRFSKQLHEYEQSMLSGREHHESTDEEATPPGERGLIPAIHRLPGNYLETKRAQYEGESKINRIRFNALETIRADGSLSQDALQGFVDEEQAKHDKDIMRAYDSFSVLGQLYIDYFRPRIRAYFDDVSNALIDEVGIDESAVHIVDFLAPRNILSDDAWFAIYPKTRGSKSDAYQLFAGIQWDGVTYGLYAGDEVELEAGVRNQVDTETITELDALTFDLLVGKFDKVLPEYYRLNEVQLAEPPERPPDEILETVERQLEAAKQVVFYGPPGTGKTFEAKRFAEWWVYAQSDGKPRDEQIETVTFHPSFSYEDFIEGLTAEATENGDVEYRVEDGVLKRVAERAQQAYDQAQTTESGPDETSGARDAPPYVLIIDEINRGNLAQILGEIITLLEADKRGSFSVSLAHSGDQFSIPPNLYVIGTMNTADQSISLVDTALRRRFRFIDFPPRLDVIWQEYTMTAMTPRDAVTQPGAADSAREQLLGASVEAVSALNKRILHAPELGKGKQLGHTYLLGHDSAQAVVDAWRYDILPQLEEYYFGQFDRLQDDLLKETGDHLIAWETEQIRGFNAESLYTALCRIAQIDDPVPLQSVSEALVSDGYGTPIGAGDSWAAGEQTVAAFRERISDRLTPRSVKRIERLLALGEELGRVDTGRGEYTATVQLKSDAIDPGVGVVQIDQDGELEFRWGWLSDREENAFTPEFFDSAAAVFDPIDAYDHVWDPDEEEFTVTTLDIGALSDEEMDALVDGLRSLDREAAQQDE